MRVVRGIGWRWSVRRPKAPALDGAALFEQLPDAALLLDGGQRVAAANRALLLALGPTQPVRPGMAPERLFAESSRPALLAWLQGAPPPGELRLAAPEGQAGRPVAPKYLPMPGGNAVLLLHDVTQRHAMAAQMAEGDRLQALGRLAGGIAHDFNNLLAVILGAADDAASSLESPSNTAAAGALEQVRQAAQRGAALVRQLLAYARQQVLAPKLVPLNDAVQGMARLLRPLLGRGISLDVILDEPGRMVRIDPSQLDRVLMNLAMNARQAMPGGGRLCLTTGRALLLEPLAGGPEEVPPGRWTVLEVADTGPGIPPELLPRIFEPFFTSRAQQGGTGLGLATVHGIVRQSGGYLVVDSAAGRGTRIRILLPRVEETDLVAPPAEPSAPAKPAPPPGDAAGPLLLVEDEAPLRSLAERALRRSGWEVAAAEDGEAALALVEEEGLVPAALVSDVMMPGMGGVALAEVLRRRFPTLPVLLVSGYAPSVVQNGLDESDMRYLAKPYRPAELVEAVKALVNG